MHIIIIGGGEAGYPLAQALSQRTQANESFHAKHCDDDDALVAYRNYMAI